MAFQESPTTRGRIKQLQADLQSEVQALIASAGALTVSGERSSEDFSRVRMDIIAARARLDQLLFNTNLQQAVEGNGNVLAALMSGLWGLVDYMEDCEKETL